MSKEIPQKLPGHIAIIMDGNGRWAKKQGLSRIRGHEAGAKLVRDIVTECAQTGIKWLTLYAFSSENWKRPSYEINFLMRLLKKYLIQEWPELMKNNIRFTAIGKLEALPKFAQDELEKTEKITAVNTGMIFSLALNYGGKLEIIDAVKKICREVKERKLNLDEIDEKTFGKYLYKPEMPDPDLLIRTGGEMRISNFLLWELSYTELYITPVLWPDFNKEELHKALKDYAKRERRFGGI
ncbi:MAG: isoprenyl transferase [Planctomycetes bacterium]|nr:isoprenyl transferase [Planctomycetota bacterium]